MKASYTSHNYLPHDGCGSSSCRVDCIAQLNDSFSLYLEEVSRVFFKKENMRNKHRWWLSTFYSFCIQSAVKKRVKDLETELYWEEYWCQPYQRYLRLPLRLFIASSGNYDPLRGDFGQPEHDDGEEGVKARDPKGYGEARIAVGQSKWVADRISGSSEYLRSLFKDS